MKNERNPDGSRKRSIRKRRPSLHRNGEWFVHSISVYRLWWEYLVRSYQSPGITVDEKFYEDWGPPKDFLNIDVLSWRDRSDGFGKFWKERGIELFREHPDRGISVITEGTEPLDFEKHFYLKIPKGTPSKELERRVVQFVRDNVKPTKNSHISTSNPKFQVSRNEVRTEGYTRWLKIWDMDIHRKDDGSRYYSIQQIHDIHGNGEYPQNTYRDLGRIRQIMENVGNGVFPGEYKN